MNKKRNKTERIHSLDALRAIMMLLGLVLHSALTYNVTNHGNSWLLKDPYSTHLFTDFIVFLIHSFRMPIFFLVAGFFGSMLFYERKPIKMVKNRISRIVYPFIVFIFILWSIIIFTFGYTKSILSGVENPIITTLSQFSNPSFFLPKTTFHLWFLYYLIFITTSTVLLGLLLKKSKKISNKIIKHFNWVIKKPLIRVLFFSGLTTLIFLFLKTFMINVSVSLIPDLNTFIFHFYFYLIGWVLFKSKHLLNTMMQYDRISVLLAVIIIIIQSLIIQKSNSNILSISNSLTLMILSSIIIWLFIFGITGLFIRFGSKYSKRMRYISDASYWVYLIHLPITAIIPAFIYKWEIPAIAKFLIVLITTTTICFVSYHYLVRNTFIGKFLNGRKYARK